MTKITPNERAVLEALADDRSHSAPDLPALSHRSSQGVGETAASLARKGLIKKAREHHRLLLKITRTGRERLEADDA
jgi:DNA-binding MarR family transcriptional regulator